MRSTGRGERQRLWRAKRVGKGDASRVARLLWSVTLLGLTLTPSVEATEFWDTDDLERAESERILVYREKPLPEAPGWRFNYVHEFTEIAEFLSNWQVLDPDSIDYGGMIEGESGAARDIIQTDNTEEAVWIWCRYAELTGDTSTYRPNVDAAWIYIMNFPAYNEEGTDSDYYRVHNCGWALVCESKYREVYGDSSFFWYSDTCAQYMTTHPLDFNVGSPTYRRLHPFVTGWAAGTLYGYGVEVAETTYIDSALSFGQRLIDWVEADPQAALTDELWAMSSGTAMWGIVNSSFREDPSQGMTWLPTYVPFMDVYEPSGQWNNSWNIWYGNAYHSIFNILGDTTYSHYHYMLTDTLIVQDTDEDGGVPATVGDPETMDQTWISCYLGFMGIEGILDSMRSLDAGVLAFLNPTEETVVVPGDSVQVEVVVSNFGTTHLVGVPVTVVTTGYLSMDTTDLAVGQNVQISFSPPWIPSADTTYALRAYTSLAGDQNLSNDTLSIEVTVLPLGVVSGWVRERTTSQGILAQLVFLRHPGHLPYDSVSTDSSGRYSLDLPMGTYDVLVFPEIPYPDTARSDVEVRDGGTTILIVELSPATLLIVDDDEGDPYETYYTSTADSLGLSYVLWAIQERGEFPMSRISELATQTILWYTGNATANTLTPADQDSLSQFLDSGGNLFLTGQNVGEDISTSSFYSDYLHASLVAPASQDHILHGVAGDPIGGGLSVATAGGGGANNQNSQDVILPVGGADSVYCYSPDSVAALKYDSGVYKVVYFGFGFEAINKVASFAGRDTVLARILTWFGIPVGTQESLDARRHPSTSLGTGMPVVRVFQNYPNPFSRTTTIPFCLQGSRGAEEQGGGTSQIPNRISHISLRVYDLSGRLVRTLISGLSNHETMQLSNQVVWDGRDNGGRPVPSGVYLYSLSAGHLSSTRKMVLVR